jgi:Cu+-exporting ATPase
MLCVALRPARESTLERLSALARSLKERPSRLQRLGDAFASVLVPLVALLALGTFAFTAMRASFEPAVIAALAVVLAACPCTYGVATPLVLWLALRKALEKGVCIRNAAALEELSLVTAVAFDKTGTLTQPDLAVLRADLTEGATREEVLAAVLALESAKRHPIARALAAWAGEANPTQLALVETRILVGRGVSGRDPAGHTWRLGSPSWLREQGIQGLDEGGADARAALARDSALLARFEIGEALRPEAEAALASLHDQGIRALMLTGDTADGAKSIAALLGMEAHAALSPIDKLDKLEALGKKVAMVGDGLNDAVALAGTGPSFAMHGGTDLAKGMAQVTLPPPGSPPRPVDTLALSPPRHAGRLAKPRGLDHLQRVLPGPRRDWHAPPGLGRAQHAHLLAAHPGELPAGERHGRPRGRGARAVPGREIPGFEGEIHPLRPEAEKVPGAAGAEA